MTFILTPPQHKKTAASAGTVFTAQKLFSMATSGSTQDVTISGVSATPVAARLFYTTNVIANSTVDRTAIFGIGFATGASNNVGQTAIHRNIRTTFSARASSDVYALICPGTAIGTYNVPIFEGIVDLIAGGIRIQWDDNPGDTYPCLLEIYWGSDVSADCGFHNMGASTTPTKLSLTNCDPSSENCLFQVASCGLPAPSVIQTKALMGFGVATNDGGISQGMALSYSETGLATSDVEHLVSASNVIGQVYLSTVSWKAAITDFSSANEIEFTTDKSANSDEVPYLCLGFGSNTGVYVGVEDCPIVTGAWGPNPGWTAQSACILTTNNNVLDTLSGNITNTFFQAASNTENSLGASVGIGVADNTTVAATYTSQATRFLYYDHEGTNLLDADADTLAINSWIDVTSETITAAQKWLCWAIEA